MNAKRARYSQNYDTKSHSKLDQYARLAQFEAVRSGDRKSCLDVLHAAQQPEPFEIDFKALKSLDDVRSLEHQIFNLMLRDQISVQKVDLCLDQLSAIGEEISICDRQKEDVIRRAKEIERERELFPAKLKYFKALDAQAQFRFLALNGNFNILFQEHQNQELQKLSKSLLSGDEEDKKVLPTKASSQSGAPNPRVADRVKPQSKISQPKNGSDLAPPSKGDELNNSFSEDTLVKTSESLLSQSAPAKTDETELRLPRVTDQSFKYFPSPWSPPRKSRW